jgi:hypothetical protein
MTIGFKGFSQHLNGYLTRFQLTRLGVSMERISMVRQRILSGRDVLRRLFSMSAHDMFQMIAADFSRDNGMRGLRSTQNSRQPSAHRIQDAHGFSHKQKGAMVEVSRCAAQMMIAVVERP